MCLRLCKTKRVKIKDDRTIVLRRPKMCDVKELKDYFENRPDRDKLNIFYMNDHFAITEFVAPFRKASKISIRQLSVILNLSFFKIIVGYIGAKLKKVKFKSIF